MSKILFSFSLSFQTEMCGITVTDICYPFSLDDVLDLSSYTDRKNDIIPCLSTPNQHTKNGKKLWKKNYLPIFFTIQL